MAARQVITALAKISPTLTYSANAADITFTQASPVVSF